MLNLLFISDNPKVEYLKNSLQPVLKVIIDVVSDFDHGLKDVFEKRPTTVCVQDQIGGVTGESVARHIQMLLGNSAPTFILLHSGNGKARVIKGLYEHLVDLSQSDEALAENMKSTLMALLGDQWDKVYIPPKNAPPAVRQIAAVPEESREEADKLVDDFLSDLENSGFTTTDELPPEMLPEMPVSTVAPKEQGGPELFAPPAHTDILFGVHDSEHIQTTSDEMAELLLAEVNKAARQKNPGTASTDGNDMPEADVDFLQQSTSPLKSPAPPPLPSLSQSASPVPPSRGVSSSTALSERAAPAMSATADIPPPRAAAPAQKTASPAKTVRPAASDKPIISGASTGAAQAAKPAAAATHSAADFRIRQISSAADDHVPGELLQAFEDNYRVTSQSVWRSVFIALFCLLCAVGVWYVAVKQPLLVSSLKQRLFSSALFNRPPAVAVSNPVTAPAQPAVSVPSVPPFIPKEGRDGEYAAKNPGWERYVGPQAEFRLFSAAGRVQAAQVLSVGEASVPAVLITTVLQNYAGSAEYRIHTRNTKAGVLVERGSIRDKGEVIVYRKNGVVKAFVLAIN